MFKNISGCEVSTTKWVLHTGRLQPVAALSHSTCLVWTWDSKQRILERFWLASLGSNSKPLYNKSSLQLFIPWWLCCLKCSTYFICWVFTTSVFLVLFTAVNSSIRTLTAHSKADICIGLWLNKENGNWKLKINPKYLLGRLFKKGGSYIKLNLNTKQSSKNHTNSQDKAKYGF